MSDPTPSMQSRRRALRKFLAENRDYLPLDCVLSMLDLLPCKHSENTFVYNQTDERYLVLTDEEADEMAAKQALKTVWLCSAEVLVDYIHWQDSSERRDIITALKAVCEKCGDRANALILAALGDARDDFVEFCVSDNRPEMIDSEDGKEHEVSLVCWDDIAELAKNIPDATMRAVLEKAVHEEDLDAVGMVADWMEENSIPDAEVFRYFSVAVDFFIYQR